MAVIVDDDPHELSAASALLFSSGRRRSLLGKEEGVRYLSVHLSRGPLQIEPRPSGD
jgi:hypothetical protein